MWKLVLASTTALVIAGSSMVYAQQRSGAPERPRWQPSQEDVAAFAAARVAALRAGLVLTPDQEKNWPAFEAALKDLTRYRTEQRATRRTEQPSQNPTERLRRYSDALSGYGAALKKLADAQEPLYSSLDDAQKRRFAILARPMRHGAASHQRHHHGMRTGMAGERGGPSGYHRRGEDGRGGADWRSGRDRGERRGDRELGRGDGPGGAPPRGRSGTSGEGERL